MGPRKNQEANAPRRPKKPLNAFMIFMRDTRAQVAQQNPALPNRDIVSMVAARWKEMPEEQKAAYVQQAEMYKLEHARKIEGWMTEAPKKPPNPYILFSQDFRPKLMQAHPELEGKDIVVELGKRWKSLTPEEKAPYVQQAAMAKDDHFDKVAKWKQQDKVAVKPKKKLKKPKPVKIPTKAPSTFLLFTKDNRAELHRRNPSWTPAQVSQELGILWRALDEVERSKYAQRVTTLQHEVNKRLKAHDAKRSKKEKNHMQHM